MFFPGVGLVIDMGMKLNALVNRKHPEGGYISRMLLDCHTAWCGVGDRFGHVSNVNASRNVRAVACHGGFWDCVFCCTLVASKLHIFGRRSDDASWRIMKRHEERHEASSSVVKLDGTLPWVISSQGKSGEDLRHERQANFTP